MAHISKNVQLSTGRIAFIIVLIVIVGVLMILRSASPSTQPDKQSVQQQTQSETQPRCVYDSSIPASSPVCPAHIMLPSGPMLTSTLPESGVCSIEEAKRGPIVDIDFGRYINDDIIVAPLWRVQWHNGTTVVLPAAVYALMKILSPEFPGDDQLTFAISPDSYESLKRSIPSLGTVTTNTGIVSSTHYVTSHRCLALAPIRK